MGKASKKLLVITSLITILNVPPAIKLHVEPSSVRF
jgi:hypothetical protein